MKYIELTKGKQAIVDDDLYDEINKYKWYYTDYYAARASKNKTKKLIRMHRYIFELKFGYCPKYIDHINNNGIDNRIENLRECTNSQNLANTFKRIKSTATSRFKGVSLHKANNKYLAQININNRTINVGYFDLELDAAFAYDEAAKALFGEFAKVNFPEKKISILSISTLDRIKNPRTKILNSDIVREIRSKYIPRKYSIRKLAKEYNVSYATISLIVLGKTWKPKEEG